jgi:hypothetical protein
MKALKRTVVIAALGLAAGGCSSIEYKPVAHEELKNAQGHVVGYKETARDARTGEEVTQIALFIPRHGARGEIVGYEERARGGSILRDLDGRRIGSRWNDVRGRANNPQSQGVIVVVRGRHERSAEARAPSIEELIRLARLPD